MASQNYYLVLGVASNESQEGLRAAFRDLARRYHPDRAGPGGNARFREVTEAYEVLSDTGRRREYDEQLQQERAPTRPADLIRDVSLRSDFEDLGPSEEAIVHRFARNFTGNAVPKGERVEELKVEIAVSQEEAARGTRVRLGVPVFRRCPQCVGRGCQHCGGQGAIEGERPVTIDVPPLSGRGTTFLMPLVGLGIHNFYLRVRIRVEV